MNHALHAHREGKMHARAPSHADDTAGNACTPCGSGAHDHGEKDHDALPGWPRIALALLLAAGAELAHAFEQPWPGMLLALASIALAGLGVYRMGLKDLARFRLGISALMTVAVTGAVLIGQWPEAAMVMALYVAAERIEHGAMDKARHAIRSLLDLAPEVADVVQADASVRRQPAAQVPTGAVLRIAPGARVPLDGVVTQGTGSVNQAPITGESQPAEKAVGDPLYAGSVNQQGELLMRVTAAASGTLIARIVHAVEQAQARRAPTQRFIDRFAAVYTPIVFMLALTLAVAAPLFMGWTWPHAAYEALALLVIACPCALVISTPVTVVSALTTAARRGVLIKGGSALEGARALRAIALDKTGTLTTGRPALVHWQAIEGANAERTARLARTLADRSDHPVSRAIASGLRAASTTTAVATFTALPGRGVQGRIDDEAWALGNTRLAQERGLMSERLAKLCAHHEMQGRAVTLLMNEAGVQGLFAVADPLREHASEAMARLKALGIHPVVLSGDNTITVRAIADQAGIADARGGLLPEDKLAALSELRATHTSVAMVGDGINDAPALAAADLGFAMGGAHASAMAMETAGIVLINDDLRRVADTVRLSRRAHRVLWQNIGAALFVKAAFCLMAVAGIATMWMAVAADMGVSLLVIANGLRLRRAGNS